MPALDVGRRLDLDAGAVGVRQIPGGPLVSDLAVGDPERLGDEVLGEDAARGVADEIRCAPLPEVEQRERKPAAGGVEALAAGSALNVDGAKLVVVRHGDPTADRGRWCWWST